jgi:hypothetical protein
MAGTGAGMKALMSMSILLASVVAFASLAEQPRERPVGGYTQWAQKSTINPYLNCVCVYQNGSSACLLTHDCPKSGGRCTAEGC